MSPFIISLAIRLTILLIAGGAITLAVHRSTYAVRHIVLAATLACVVALPLAMFLVPEWRVAILPASPSTMETIVTAIPAAAPSATAPSAAQSEFAHPGLITSQLDLAAAPAPAPRDARSSLVRTALALSIPQVVLILWLAGVCFGLAWIIAGRIGLARVRRHATPLKSYEWRTILEAEAMHAGVARHVALFTSPAVSMPVTWGVLRPVIVLPESALAWSHDRKRVVVMHEMAHIARRDSATQLIATFACVAYWLHPLVLLAARRLRAECERACDERVLERGTPAAEYAAHLLDVAKYARSFGAASIVSVAMARPSQLEGRLLAVLRAEPRRARTTPRTRALAALAAAAMLVVISAFKPVVREAVRHTVVRTTVHTVASARPVAAAAPVVAMAKKAQVAATASTTAAVQSHPDSTFEKTVPAKTGGVLELDLDTGGDIEIVGTDDDKVSVNGSLGGHDWRDMTVKLDTRGDVAQLTSRYVGRSETQMFDNAFKIRVPKHFDVRIASSGGNVSINGVDGRFTGTTAGGAIEIQHANGKANLSTGGGNIRVSNSHLDGSVTTGGGTVNLDAVTGGLVGASGSSAGARGGFDFRWPESAKMPELARMPEMAKMPAMARLPEIAKLQTDAMKQSMKAMERAQEALARDREEIERAQAMADDEGMKESERALRFDQEDLPRIREEMQRYDILMDSTREPMENDSSGADSTKVSFRYKVGPMKYEMAPLKYYIRTPRYKSKGTDKERRALEESLSAMQDSNRTIVIDKDGGSIRVLRAPKGARLRTGGGNIVIDDAGDAATAMTGAGDITVSAGKGPAHPVDVVSGKGNVEVSIPEGADVTLDLESAYTESFGRRTKIVGDLPLEVTETPDWDSTHGTPRKYVRVKQKIGKGGALIRVRTVNGDIRLKVGS